jgi:hypothetical protein
VTVARPRRVAPIGFHSHLFPREPALVPSICGIQPMRPSSVPVRDMNHRQAVPSLIWIKPAHPPLAVRLPPSPIAQPEGPFGSHDVELIEKPFSSQQLAARVRSMPGADIGGSILPSVAQNERAAKIGGVGPMNGGFRQPLSPNLPVRCRLDQAARVGAVYVCSGSRLCESVVP